MYRRRQHILLVDDDPFELYQVTGLLQRRDYSVAGVRSVDEARERIAHWPVDLIASASRIGSMSGLQFILACRASNPNVAAVLIAPQSPQVVDMDAWRHGIAVASHPINGDQLLMIVAEQLAGVRRRQRWPRKRITAHVPVQAAGTLGRLVDVSYGGLRIQLSGEDAALPMRLLIDMPDFRLRITAELVWSIRGQDGTSCECGVAVSDDPASTPNWCSFVDRVS
ncbi:MAG TPA: response regulator [Vicinamibacterales bacterium]|nr:response regulator [Vicinamibacterales bacterium]